VSKNVMIDLMTRLSEDAKESHEFKKNPDRLKADLDLTEQEKEMLKRAQREEIQDYLGGETRRWLFMIIGHHHHDHEDGD
jgi:hypothetical protein